METVELRITPTRVIAELSSSIILMLNSECIKIAESNLVDIDGAPPLRVIKGGLVLV